MKKFLLLALLAPAAHAGIGHFALGYIAGASSNSSAPQPATPILLTADDPKHDIIMCPVTPDNKCGREVNEGELDEDWDDKCRCRNYHGISPEQFAGNAGYKTIYSRALLILQKVHGDDSTSNIRYYVLEVSR